jgi:hypothetical protein
MLPGMLSTGPIMPATNDVPGIPGLTGAFTLVGLPGHNSNPVPEHMKSGNNLNKAAMQT